MHHHVCTFVATIVVHIMLILKKPELQKYLKRQIKNFFSRT